MRPSWRPEGATLAETLRGPVAPVADAGPNVLLVTAAQLRFDCVGALGNPVIRTPSLDALAAGGIVFRNAYTASTDGAAARRSLLSGIAPSAAAGRGMEPAGLLRGFHERGYRTAAIGDVPLFRGGCDGAVDTLHTVRRDVPGREPDDYHDGFLAEHGLGRGSGHDSAGEEGWAAPLTEGPDDGRAGPAAQPRRLSDDLSHTAWIADRAIGWLASHDPALPFFAWTSFLEPHDPYAPPAPYAEAYQPDAIPLPPGGSRWRSKPLLTVPRDARLGGDASPCAREGPLRRAAALYYGLVSHLDHHVGRILSALGRLGLRDRTIVIVTSDHGDYLGQYGLCATRPNVPYDALARVPLIVGLPAGTPGERGASCAALVSTMDILPTLAGMAGVDAPRGAQGRDVRGVLRDPGTSRNQPVFVETGAFRAVRSERYKYVYSGRWSEGELYDVLADPFEMSDLSDELPEVVRDHRGLLLDWAIACGMEGGTEMG